MHKSAKLRNIFIFFLIFTIGFCTFNYMYKRYLGYFTSISLAHIVGKYDYPCKIYKSNEKYLIIDNKFNLYTFNGIDKNKLVGIKKLDLKIDINSDYFQLNNGLVVFYSIDSKVNRKIRFMLFDINKEKFVKKLESKLPINEHDYNTKIIPYEKANFIIVSRKVGPNNQTSIQTVNTTNSFIKTYYIKNYIFYGVIIPIKDKLLIMHSDLSPKLQKTYIYNINEKSLSKIKNLNINRTGNTRLRFVVIDEQYLFGIEYFKGNNYIFLYDIKNLNNITELYYLKLPQNRIKEDLSQSNIAVINKNEVLITGGEKWWLIGCGETSKSYILNIKTKKITRISDMNFANRNHLSIKTNGTSILLYSPYAQNNRETIQIFEKGKLW